MAEGRVTPPGGVEGSAARGPGVLTRSREERQKAGQVCRKKLKKAQNEAVVHGPGIPRILPGSPKLIAVGHLI